MTFVAEHTERLRGENPDMTMEQVCRALVTVCGSWLRRRRGTSEQVCVLAVIVYHQRRNRMASIESAGDPLSLELGKNAGHPEKNDNDDPLSVHRSAVVLRRRPLDCCLSHRIRRPSYPPDFGQVTLPFGLLRRRKLLPALADVFRQLAEIVRHLP